MRFHLKAGYDAQSFMSRILSENWFGLSLNVEYDGDNLKRYVSRQAFFLLY